MENVTKNKVLYIILAVLIVLNIVSISSMWLRSPGKPHQQFRHDGQQMMQQGNMPNQEDMQPEKDGKGFLTNELQFSSGQEEKVAKLREEHFLASKKLMDESHKIMDEMMEQMKTGNDAKAEEYATQVAAKHKELVMLNYNHFKGIREICDDKQKEKFDIFLKDVVKMMGPHGPHKLQAPVQQGQPQMQPQGQPPVQQQRAPNK